MRYLCLFSALCSVLFNFSCESNIQSGDVQFEVEDQQQIPSFNFDEEFGLVSILDVESAALLEKAFKSPQAKTYEDAALAIPSFRSAEKAYRDLGNTSFEGRSELSEDELLFARTVERDDEIYVERVIDNPMLSYLANDKGWLKVGDLFYKITFDVAYTTSKDDYILHKQGLNLNELSSLKAIEIERSSVKPIEIVEKAIVQADCEDFYGTRRRLVVEQMTSSSIFNPGHINNFIRSRHLRRNKWPKWFFGEEADQLTLTWDMTFISLATFEEFPTSGTILRQDVQSMDVDLVSGNNIFLNSQTNLTGTASDGGGNGACSVPN